MPDLPPGHPLMEWHFDEPFELEPSLLAYLVERFGDAGKKCFEETLPARLDALRKEFEWKVQLSDTLRQDLIKAANKTLQLPPLLYLVDGHTASSAQSADEFVDLFMWPLVASLRDIIPHILNPSQMNESSFTMEGQATLSD